MPNTIIMWKNVVETEDNAPPAFHFRRLILKCLFWNERTFLPKFLCWSEMGEGFFLMAKLLFHVMDSSWRSISPSGQLEGLKQPLRHSWETSSVLRLVFSCGSPRFTFYLELVEVAAQDHSRNHIENKIALHFQSFITLCAADPQVVYFL